MRNMISKNRFDPALALIFIPIIATHIMTLFNDFHTDDWQILALLHDGFGWRDFLSMENLSNFRPFTNIVIFIRSFLFDSIPAFWYLLNIALHLLVTALLYYFTAKHFNRNVAIFAALFFGIYFQHYEGILWTYGIVRLLAAINLLCTLMFYFNYRQNGNKRDLILSCLFYFLAVFTVEEMVIFSGLLFLGLIYHNKNQIGKNLLEGSLYPLIAILYVLIRAVAIEPDPSTEYYFAGLHAFKNYYYYCAWFLLPDLNHPYFKPFVGRFVPLLGNYAELVNLLSFMIFTAGLALIFIKGKIKERVVIIFLLVSLILPSVLDAKVSPKLVYPPSIAFAIILGLVFNRAYQALQNRGKKVIVAILTAYLLVHALAINATIYFYHITQQQVRRVADNIASLPIDWDNYDYLILDNVSGRARPGHLLKYRIGFNVRLYLRNEYTEDLAIIEDELNRLRSSGENYIYIDYNNGAPRILEHHTTRVTRGD